MCVSSNRLRFWPHHRCNVYSRRLGIPDFQHVVYLCLRNFCILHCEMIKFDDFENLSWYVSKVKGLIPTSVKANYTEVLHSTWEFVYTVITHIRVNQVLTAQAHVWATHVNLLFCHTWRSNLMKWSLFVLYISKGQIKS